MTSLGAEPRGAAAAPRSSYARVWMEIEPMELSRYRKISCDEAIRTFSTKLVTGRCFASR